MKPVELRHASRLVNHGPTVLVTSAHDGRRNVMAAAWSMPVEFVPPRIAVVIDKKTATAELVAASGVLGLCVPGRAIADITYTVGSTSLHEMAPGSDKFARWGIGFDDSPTFGVPLVHGCAGWMECRVLPEAHTQSAYDTWFVEVVAAWADERVFAAGHWSFRDDNAALHTLHHIGAGLFGTPGVQVQALMRAPRLP
jgi:flavin reductase (DIM6/NTAB) family NADH-FMN oxidoreductase RutF